MYLFISSISSALIFVKSINCGVCRSFFVFVELPKKYKSKILKEKTNMILDLLKKRYSCRGFNYQKIPNHVINYIVECGRLAPSGGNEQPWKFGIITDKVIIDELAKASSYLYDQSWITSAPLIIALCTQIKLYFCEVVHIAGENMVIAAMEHGVYSTWIGCLDRDKATELLEIDGYYLTSMISFGYPITERSPTPKKNIEDITFTNNFNAKGVIL